MPAGVSVCVSMIRQRPVGAPCQIGGKELDEASGRLQAVARPQEGRIAEHEGMRYGARRQQSLGAVEVCQDALEQPRPLHESALEPMPFPRRHDERHEIDAPGLRRAGGIGEEIVGDPGLAHARVELLHAQQARGGIERGERLEQRLPMRLDGAGAVDQLVEASSQGLIAPRQVAICKRLCSCAAGHRLLLHPPAHLPVEPVALLAAAR